jgi:transposase
MLTAAELPNDIDALKALLLARDEQIVGLQAQLSTRAAEIEHPEIVDREATAHAVRPQVRKA